MDKSSKIWNSLKVIAAVIPSFSLVMACLYYVVFFSNFDGLELNILTLSDYFNKAVEFIPLAFYVLFGLLFAVFIYPPKHDDETIEQHHQRIGGSEKTYNRLDRFFLIMLFTAMPVCVVTSFFTLTMHYFLMIAPAIFLFWIIFFLNKMSKHFPLALRNTIYTSMNLFLFIGIFVGANTVLRTSLNDARDIRKLDAAETILIDIIDAGYLKKEKRTLVLFDKEWEEISVYEIQEPTTESFGCSVGFKFSCVKEKNEAKAE